MSVNINVGDSGLIIEEDKFTPITFENIDYEDDEDDEGGENANDENYDIFVYVFFGDKEQRSKLEKATEEEGHGTVFNEAVDLGRAYIKNHDSAASNTAFSKLVNCPIM
ncbi:hypothetical protein IWW37_002192 [Coemansia sp. RSA 2050]|nr:hypothetical protein IWW37_002192 [Coemansia sp. RSA 2050]